ncbi:MAG: SRPBCC family protein [Oscillospiraceae bacterium]|nr:SRPBCC family protein [Oscillospiraceae bacterium]
MSASCDTVSLEFGCSPEQVWAVLTDAARYGEWYGYPRSLEIVEVDPAFTAGGKISFKGLRGTSVITACEPGEHFAVSSSTETNDFSISPTAEGCRVSLFTTLNGEIDWSGTAAARSRANREMLHRLRRAAGIEKERESELPLPKPEAPQRGSLIKNVFSGMLLGYKNPLKRRAGAARDSIALAQLIDNTEADVVVHTNAALAGLALALRE